MNWVIRFARSCDGNVSLIFAMLLVLLLAASGIGYDFSRATVARTVLQATVDGAVLAAGASDTTDAGTIDELAQAYLAANEPSSSVVTLGDLTTSYDAATKTIAATLTGQTSTVFMNLVGIPNVNVSASSEARRSEPGPLELVLALDTTLSMNNLVGGVKKITTAKAAAVNLVNTVMASPFATVGVVPFSSGMTIGTQFKDKNWVFPRPDYTLNTCVQVVSVPGTGESCITTYPPCVVDGISTTCLTKTCTYVVPPVYTTQCTDVPHVWNGCVSVRKNFEGSIDSPTNPKYPWTTNICAPQIRDLSTSKTDVVNRINTLTVAQDTYIPIGLVWAWNMLTPEEPLTSARTKQDMADNGGKKVVVLMTDGVNSLAPYYLANGASGLATITTPAKQAMVDNTLRQLCTDVKNDGILIYTIAFDVQDANIRNILRNCASDTDWYFDAQDTALLNEAFSKIGESLKRLRLSR